MAALSLEILTGKTPSPTAIPMLAGIKAAALAAGDSLKETKKFQGGRDWLVLFGVGAQVHDVARKQQIRNGGRALLIDLGYFGRAKVTGYLRISIDQDHPQAWLDRTQPDATRWARHGIELREDADTNGPILLIGLGRKSRAYLGVGENWEREQLKRINARFPGRTVIHRPKPGHDEGPRLACERDDKSPIEKLLKGASLVVCRHSNVAVDATVAGVPFEAEDGAAVWLAQRQFTRDNRLDFLLRLAHWQWKSTEAAQAWAFAKGIADGSRTY